ncbi:MAG TPA: chorismate mutase [Candidatus Eremiobacteraceae bacterium]|nr:chorismate mutase [Candidatus Eremiobacteraceae bacterium]
MITRGIRGAVTAAANDRDAILDATSALLAELVRANSLEPEAVAAVFFTTSADLNAAYPAEAARAKGWTHVPLLCSHEMVVPGGLPACIRVLMLVNTDVAQTDIKHIYLGGAASLRPDLRAP